MTLRPESMDWIDLVTTVDAAGRVLETLAATGAVQLQAATAEDEFSGWSPGMPETSGLRDLRAQLRSLGSAAPVADVSQTTDAERAAPGGVGAEDVRLRIEGWLEAVREPMRRIGEIDGELQAVARVRGFPARLPEDVDLGLWRSGGERFQGFLVEGPRDDVDELLAGRSAPGAWLGGIVNARGDVAVAGLLAPVERRRELAGIVSRAGLRVLEVPNWVEGTPRAAAAAAEAYGVRLAAEREALLAGIHQSASVYRVAGARWLVERACWLDEAARHVQVGDRFVRIGGWAPVNRHGDIVRALENRGLPYLARFGDGAGHGVPPSLLRNPPWARRFELFVRGFGMPARDEVDSTLILALVTPLMFGYMFGDVGQGLVLLAFGLVAGPRLSWARLLVPAGLSAMVFGLLFGSVFSIETLIPPLWLHPMEHPLTLLVMPVAFGALLILASLGLGAVEAGWRGRRGAWLAAEGPPLACFLALPILMVSWQWAAALVAVATIAALLHRAVTEGAGRALAKLPLMIVEMFEKALQMVINALSFSRLGAFALGHAGLSGALVSLAELPGTAWGWVLVMVLGNAFVIALEGLVVSIQTTRLVMFEFFRRFFEGRGRLFSPLTLAGHPGPAIAAEAGPSQ